VLQHGGGGRLNDAGACWQPWQSMGTLAQLLLRVEDLSHCLVWHHGAPDRDDATPCSVHRVELPRLGLTFTPKPACQEYPGAHGKADGVDPWRFDPFADSTAQALADPFDPFADPADGAFPSWVSRGAR
jgi:hypothetical protein